MLYDARHMPRALITGASSGIGAALAKLLAAQGTEVVLCARREDALREQVEAITAAGGQARFEVLDVGSDPARTQARIRELDEQLAFDLVVANAGVGGSRWSGKLQWEDCAKIIGVNVSGAVATLTGALPGMVARKRGHLVGVSSIAGYRGLPSSAAYCASKAFLSVFLESLRVDLHAVGVAVTDVRPGFVETPMTDGMKSLPFLVDVEAAAKIIARAIRRKRGVVSFPVPLAVVGHMLPMIPGGIFEGVVRRGRPGR
jgi:short-subunit dehydrogenase